MVIRRHYLDQICPFYIRVAHMMPTKETRDREFGALLSVPDQYRKIVLSMDHFDFSRDGIEHVRLPDFMLGEAK